MAFLSFSRSSSHANKEIKRPFSPNSNVCLDREPFWDLDPQEGLGWDRGVDAALVLRTLYLSLSSKPSLKLRVEKACLAQLP
jgi:DNA primase